MDVELRQLRCLVAIVAAGTFTDAAIELGISQAAVSRTVAALEAELGVRVLAPARRALAEADNVIREATTGHTSLRIGYAWSAVGRHTLTFQRRWAALRPGTDLQFVRTNTATGGLDD